MKIQILYRYEPNSEWHEIYANGDLLFEGDFPIEFQAQVFINWLDKQPEMEVEIRNITVEYIQGPGEDYMPPVHSMTGESYWSDWENAGGN